MKKAIQLYDQATVLDADARRVVQFGFAAISSELVDLSQSSEVAMQVASDTVEDKVKRDFVARQSMEREKRLGENYARMEKGDNSFLDEPYEKPADFIPVEFLMVQVTGANQFWILFKAAFRVLFSGKASFIFKKPLKINQLNKE